MQAQPTYSAELFAAAATCHHAANHLTTDSEWSQSVADAVLILEAASLKLRASASLLARAAELKRGRR